MRDPRPASDRPLLWLAVAALAIAGAVVLWLVRPALGQTRQPGVGLPVPASIPAEWRSSWCPQLRLKPGQEDTWAAPETFAAMQAAGWDWRARCPNGWSGWFAEWFPRTTDALAGGWASNTWGTRDTHDGRYTLREFEYAEVYWPKCGSEYRALWWEHSAEGGSRDRPYTITAQGSAAHAAMVERAKQAGAWPAYMETALWPGGPAPCSGWPFWIRNEVGELPPPTPTPTPTPEPPAPTPAPPQPTPEPPCLPLPGPREVETLESVATWHEQLGAARRGRLRGLAAWWAGVARVLREHRESEMSTGRLTYCLREEPQP